jgi:hypothetical protein
MNYFAWNSGTYTVKKNQKNIKISKAALFKNKENKKYLLLISCK